MLAADLQLKRLHFSPPSTLLALSTGTDWDPQTAEFEAADWVLQRLSTLSELRPLEVFFPMSLGVKLMAGAQVAQNADCHVEVSYTLVDMLKI
eukprot:s1208_g4.t1